jgi:hypothetical protein
VIGGEATAMSPSLPLRPATSNEGRSPTVSNISYFYFLSNLIPITDRRLINSCSFHNNFRRCIPRDKAAFAREDVARNKNILA